MPTSQSIDTVAAVSYDSSPLTDLVKEPEPKFIANDWVQLRELLNQVWDLGLLLLLGCTGGAYELRGQVWFLRDYRARGFSWRSGVF